MALWVRGDLCVSLGHAAGRSIEFISQHKLADAVTELIGQPEGAGAQRNKRVWCRQSEAREQGNWQRESACAGRQKKENCLWCCNRATGARRQEGAARNSQWQGPEGARACRQYHPGAARRRQIDKGFLFFLANQTKRQRPQLATGLCGKEGPGPRTHV